jgi:hypothetical protein
MPRPSREEHQGGGDSFGYQELRESEQRNGSLVWTRGGRMIREVELEYTVYNLVRLSEKVWGENSTEYLAGRLDSIITYKQMKVLIDSLKEEAGE